MSTARRLLPRIQSRIDQEAGVLWECGNPAVDLVYPAGYIATVKIERTIVFAKWLDSLRDLQARARIQARIARLADDNPGHSRNLTGGISELKVDVGIGYRVY